MLGAALRLNSSDVQGRREHDVPVDGVGRLFELLREIRVPNRHGSQLQLR